MTSPEPDYKALYAAEMKRTIALTLELDRVQKLLDDVWTRRGFWKVVHTEDRVPLAEGLIRGLKAIGVD